VLGRGYNFSVDWWTLGVLMFVLLTGRQPFAHPKTNDPMEVMKRIVDENWAVEYPPYLSNAAKVGPCTLPLLRSHKRSGKCATSCLGDDERARHMAVVASSVVGRLVLVDVLPAVRPALYMETL
jgi:serine/threonine protein kinase